MITNELTAVFQWLIQSTLAGTVLLMVILFVRMLIRGHIRIQVVYWLWVLLLLRLVWPFHVETAFSVFNWVPVQHQSPESVLVQEDAEDTHDASAVSAPPVLFDEAMPSTSEQITANPKSAPSPLREGTAAAAFDWVGLCVVFWLIGVSLIGAWVAVGHYRLWRIVHSERLVTQQGILELLEDCKNQLGLQTVIGIVETDKVRTPCLFGYLRPRVLLPEGILDALTSDELRYVFLHELAHLKRHDILVGWLMAAVQILHWFNPAIWYAVGQIDRDRELACDELALLHLKENESKEYGATILLFLQRFARRQKLPAVAGIAENQSLLKRRITMIAQFKNQRKSWLPVLSLVVIAGMLAATTFTAAQTDSEGKAPAASSPSQAENTSPSKPEMLAADDGKSAGHSSIAGSGHIVLFEPGHAVELVAVRIYGSRYGTPQPPNENFYVWIADENKDVIHTFEYPYALIKRGNPKWYMLKTEPAILPEKFYLCVGFNPEQTKGVYLHHDDQASGQSYIGLPYDNEPFKPFEKGDWMIRAVVRPAGEKKAVSGSLQSMIDAAEPGATVEIPAGTYEEPIIVNKSLVLKGVSADDCTFKVTADKPAVFIDTAGGKARLENITIQWQLASSDQHEYPFAVAVKDTDAVIENCIFRPLGNPQRSPVAVRSMGFSDMKVMDCDFMGFDYVVCYGEGTKGKMQGCFIRNCGHQGVILYSNAQAEVVGNIITGSGYHAVRTTGGRLDMRDNLIINNKNRGVYLGNKSGSGRIVNNLLIGNATGIDGISASRFTVENNVILKSTYAAIAARPYAQLAVRNNVLMNNLRGIIVHQEEGKSDPIQSKFARNMYWKNQTDVENCEKGDGAMDTEPEFIDAANGNFKLSNPEYGSVGLREPETLYYLWKKYKEKM